MKKIIILFASVFLIIVLAACGETTSEEKEIGSVESSDKADKDDDVEENDAEEAEESEDATSETEEVGEVIADDEYIKATLVSVERVNDEVFDEEYYDVKIELENKTGETLEVQANEVSIDNTMVDDMVFFSETVAGEKNANGVLTIQNYEGDLPTMDENIEFILNIIDGDSFETIAEHDVKVDL